MAETYVPRLKQQYNDEVVARLKDELGLGNVMQVPRLEKIVLNMGVGDAVKDGRMLDAAVADLTTITGQKPVITKARKSIAGFKLREGMPIGVKVTLRGNATDTRRSIISYMRSPRSVTLQPIDMPSRSLKPAIDLRALVITGC